MIHQNTHRRGFMFPLIVFGIVAIAGFVTFVHFMSRGYSNQVTHADEYSRARSVAESKFADVMALLRTKPWRERFFTPRPYYETGTSDLGGDFELYVLDTPGRPHDIDIYIQVAYKRSKRLFFWRVRYENSILDAAGKNFPLIFVATAARTLNTGTSPMGAVVDNLLADRQKNATEAARIKELADPLTSPLDLLSALNGPTNQNVLDQRGSAPVEISAPAALLPPPPPPLTTVYEETFDGESAGNNPITGFIPAENGEIGQITHAESASTPGSYQLARGKQQYMPISIGNRMVYEFDIKVTQPDPGSTGGDTYIGPAAKIGENRFGGYNRLSFNANDRHINFTADQGNPAMCKFLTTWKMNQFSHIKVDLDFDTLTGDLYVDGNKLAEKFPIMPKSFTANNPWTGSPVTMTLDHFQVGGHGAPYQSFIDNIRISK